MLNIMCPILKYALNVVLSQQNPLLLKKKSSFCSVNRVEIVANLASNLPQNHANKSVRKELGVNIVTQNLTDQQL